MKSKQCIYLHDREVIPKQNECWDVNDVLRAVPEMREELGRSRGSKPDEVARDHVPGVLSRVTLLAVMILSNLPPRQMKTTVIRRQRTLVNNVPNESRASEKSEGIEQLVNLDETDLSASTNGVGWRRRHYHRICYIWMNGPYMPFHEK